MEKLVSVKELAKFLGIREMTVYKHVKAGRLPSMHVGKLLRFDLELISKLLQEGKLFATGASNLSTSVIDEK